MTDKFALIKATYYYGNGDYYKLSGYINGLWYTNPFQAGDKIYALTDDEDLFYSPINETGFQGYYEIESAQNFTGFQVGLPPLKISEYYDSETQTLVQLDEESRWDSSLGFGNEFGTLGNSLNSCRPSCCRFQARFRCCSSLSKRLNRRVLSVMTLKS